MFTAFAVRAEGAFRSRSQWTSDQISRSDPTDWSSAITPGANELGRREGHDRQLRERTPGWRTAGSIELSTDHPGLLDVQADLPEKIVEQARMVCRKLD